MEKFTVQLAGAQYEIEPQENGTFRVIDNGDKIGVIYPEPGNLAVEWKTMDELESGFVSQIGELISEYEIGKSTL